MLSGAKDPIVVKIITFINSNNATMVSAFHRFLVLELNSDSSKTPNQLSEKPLARKYFFDGPFSDSRYPRWVKPGANRFFLLFRKWKLFYSGRWLVYSVEIVFFIVYEKNLIFWSNRKKRENGITKIGNAKFWTNFEAKCKKVWFEVQPSSMTHSHPNWEN